MQTDEKRGMQVGIRKGAWTVEEDYKLINYINAHGQGHWNLLAQSAGLKRSGRSCRLRWMNYLRPGVKHGNLTLQEQFIILHCHCCWGNRWSKIANHLPGRTDNEIKNYWRTRIQKQAHQLNCQPNSQEFRDAIRYILLPKLLEHIEAGSSILNSTSNREPATSSFNNIANTMSTFDTSSHDLSKDQVFSSDSNFMDFDDVLDNNWISSDFVTKSSWNSGSSFTGFPGRLI